MKTEHAAEGLVREAPPYLIWERRPFGWQAVGGGDSFNTAASLAAKMKRARMIRGELVVLKRGETPNER